jgi:C-terminal processing protease CtpA/Prc
MSAMRKYLMVALLAAGVTRVVAGSYIDDFRELHRVLGENSATVRLHNTDWEMVAGELMPQGEQVESDEEFGRLCQKLVARLQDSHAGLINGTSPVPQIQLPKWDGGFACLKDAEGNAVVYYVADGSSADRKGVKPGMTVVEINGIKVEVALEKARREINEYIGYSTGQYLDYHTYHWFARQYSQGDAVALILRDAKGRRKQAGLRASEEAGYLPRLPVPIDDISDGGGDIQWEKLKNNIGYIYVRRIKQGLEQSLDKAVRELKNTDGIIIDVRGNSGGGFNFNTAHYNFDPESAEESGRIKYSNPVAVLISPRCISAGEGWASWFVANKRATFFGVATAGASGRKTTYTLSSGRFKVRYVVKPYKGYLDRYIEGRGLEPDVAVVQTAEDLDNERDTVLEAAREYLMSL